MSILQSLLEILKLGILLEYLFALTNGSLLHKQPGLET